jgi:hypothetical protein
VRNGYARAGRNVTYSSSVSRSPALLRSRSPSSRIRCGNSHVYRYSIRIENMRKSVTRAARDLKVLGRLAIVPGLIAVVIALLVLIFAYLSLTDPRPVVPWFGTAMWTGTVAAIALGWFATGVRSGSTLIIGIEALTFLLGGLLLVVWQSRAGDVLDVVMTALVATILVASSCWALHFAHKLHSRFQGYPLPPHATRRLSVPRDARALRALGPALLGGLQVLAMLGAIVALAPLLRQGAISVSVSFFMPTALRHFRRIRAVLALRAQEVRLEDRRLPILLLRSFADDELAMQRTKARLVNVTKTALSLEELIVAQLWDVGPVVAIGQPALEVDPIGAAHERILGPLWQPRVQALIEESALVVVVLGQTEGLFWEYEQLARRRVSVLAILPPSDANILVDRWQHFAAIYPPALAIPLEEVTSELPLLVEFHADHEPLIVSGQPRDERSYELAFMMWRQTRAAETLNASIAGADLQRPPQLDHLG